MTVKAIKCLKCKDVIYSRAIHDFRWCSCGNMAVDGGFSYLKIVGIENDYNILGRSNQAIGPLGDFALEVDTKLISGPDDIWYGIGFRQQDKENSYDFLINSGESEGKASFAILKQVDGEWIALKDWTESNDINGGKASNHLKIICKGNTIEVYANDHRLAKVTDSTYSKGIITFEAAKETGDNASVSFDDLLLYVPR